MAVDIAQLLQEIVKRLVSVSQPQKVILFGSYARGTPTQHSDLDILVVEKLVPSRFKEMIRLRRALRGLAFPIDILVISEEEFQNRSSIPSTVYYWAKKEGKILYDAA